MSSLHAVHFLGSQLCFFRARSPFGDAYGATGQHAQQEEKVVTSQSSSCAQDARAPLGVLLGGSLPHAAKTIATTSIHLILASIPATPEPRTRATLCRMALLPWEIAVATAGTAALAIVAPSRVKFVVSRMSLALAARRDSAKTSAARLLYGSIAKRAMWCVSMEHEGRVVEAYPGSLGFLRDDPPYTWWSVSSSAKTPARVTVSVWPKAHVEKWPRIDWEPRVSSGDDAFDARFWSKGYSQKNADLARQIIHSAEVRSHIEALISSDADSVDVGTRIAVTRRRNGLSWDDLRTQMQRVAELGRAVERVFEAPLPYR
jgi:hypothetical protein